MQVDKGNGEGKERERGGITSVSISGMNLNHLVSSGKHVGIIMTFIIILGIVVGTFVVNVATIIGVQGSLYRKPVHAVILNSN
jgi:hypothetical protein